MKKVEFICFKNGLKSNWSVISKFVCFLIKKVNKIVKIIPKNNKKLIKTNSKLLVTKYISLNKFKSVMFNVKKIS